jgi:hypothetical protein
MEELHYGLNREDQRKMAFRNEHNKNIRSKTPTKTTQHGHNRTHSAMTKYSHRDTFIPGHYNIIQNKKSYKNRRINSNYAPNYDYLSQTPMYGYNMAGITSYCALYSYYSPSVPYYMPFSHPHQSNTAMMSWNSDHSLSSFQHNRDKKKGRRSPLPEKTLRMPILPVQYIIMKPNNKQDYSVSGRIRYYPISAKKYVDALNYVFQVVYL